jgi:hypothetical protein
MLFKQIEASSVTISTSSIIVTHIYIGRIFGTVTLHFFERDGTTAIMDLIATGESFEIVTPFLAKNGLVITSNLGATVKGLIFYTTDGA